MAILINDIIQGIGAEVITLLEADSINLEPGVHIVKQERTILNNSFSQWAVYSSYDQELKRARSQIWIPMTESSETVDMFFIRTASNKGEWTSYRKYSSGDKLITLKDFESNIFSLVDNTDPLNPKIKQDSTKADKLTGSFTPDSLVAVDASGNIKSSEKQLDWILPYTLEFTDAYVLELYFAKDYDNLSSQEPGYKGYAYSTITPAEMTYKIVDRNNNVVSPDVLTFDNWRGVSISNNSLKFVKYTKAGDYVGIPANAVVFNNVKEYVENQSTSFTGSVFVDFTMEFNIDGKHYVETRTVKILGIYGKRNVWLEQGDGTSKYRLESTYVDLVDGKNPQFYTSEAVDSLVNRITIPGGHEGQIMVFGNPSVAGDIYRWLDVATSISTEANRSNTKIPTEKAIADYVDKQVEGRGVASFGYNKDNHKLTLTRSDSTELVAEIPIASSTVDGLMTKDDKQSINNLVAEVSMLSGKARIVGNVGSNPSASDINAFWESVKGQIAPEDMVGSIVLNMDQGAPVGHQWMFVQMSDGSYTWLDMGQGTVGTATNTALGIVKGVEAGVGYNYHASFINQVGDGTPYLTKTLTNTVDPTFQIKITGVDEAGNIVSYELTPKTGVNSKFLSKVEFTNSSIGSDKFRFDITSFASGQGEGYVSVNANGEMYTNGYLTLREQVEHQLNNKVDKQGINIRSTDGFIQITGESPNFAIGLNIAGSREMIDLTPLIDGVTTSWDLHTMDIGKDVQGDVTFWYGDGRLIPAKDYTFEIVKDEDSGEILAKNLVCLNTPAWDPSENRTLYAEVTKTSLISDISGISTITSGDGSLIFQKQGASAEMRVNTIQVLENTKKTIAAPTESTSMISEGTVMEYIQSLSNNVRYLLDNAVWKNSNTDLPLKIAFQSTAVTPEAGVNKIQIDPNDLGQN